MTAHVGDRIETVGTRPVTLTVDAVAIQADGHTWMSTHDDAGNRHYVSGEDTVRVGRHRDENPTLTPALTLIATAEDHTWPQGRGWTICGYFTDPHQALPIPDPSGRDLTYRVVFDYLAGQQVEQLIARAGSAGELAEVIHRYTRPRLIGPDVRVEVDLDALHGRIMCGLRPVGTFTVEHEVLPPPIPVVGSLEKRAVSV